MAFQRILVPIKGDKVDTETVRLACSLSTRKKTSIIVVYVIEMKRTLPLEAEIEPEIRKGEGILEQAEKLAGQLECSIDTELLQARDVGAAIVDEAAARDVDLIVIGVAYKKRFGEFSLGNITPFILKNAPCRVLVYREPVEEPPREVKTRP